MTTELHCTDGARYSVGEAAVLMGVDRSTIRRWIDGRKLRCGYLRHNARRFIYGRELRRFYNNVVLA